MPACVIADIRLNVASVGQALLVRFPGFARSHQMAHHIIGRDRAGVAVVIGDDLARRQHEIVANRRMRIGVVLRPEAVAFGQAIQIRHRRIADDTRVVVVLFNDNKNVLENRKGLRKTGNGNKQKQKSA